MYSDLILPGILCIAIGLLIIIYGVRFARIYAIVSALGLAILVGLLLSLFLASILRMAGNMLIPILIAIALAILLLYWVAKAYMIYLKIYAIIGMIKIIASILALCLLLLHLQGGIVALAVLIAIAGVIWLIKSITKWAHLLYMIGIITDGAVIAVTGSILVGAHSAHNGIFIILAAFAIPLLIWTGLYRECWRQKLAFPGIKSW